MRSMSGFDMIALFLLGAAIATGNPAVAELGMPGILLPVVIALLFLAIGTDRIPDLAPWVAAFYICFIFLWYEQYKLLGDEGSVQLFTTLTNWLGVPGHEKFMRVGVGTCEIIASLFLLVPAVQGLGAIGAVMLMSGAIFFHLVTPLGVDPYHDGGVLFKEACSVLTCAFLVIWWRREQIVGLAHRFGIPLPMIASR